MIDRTFKDEAANKMMNMIDEWVLACVEGGEAYGRILCSHCSLAFVLEVLWEQRRNWTMRLHHAPPSCTCPPLVHILRLAGRLTLYA